MNHKLLEDETKDVSWADLTQEERTELIVRQAVFIELTRKYIQISAVHATDMRNLLIMLAIVLVMNLFSADNRIIILSLLTSQILVTLFSKVSYSTISSDLEETKKSYSEFIKSKQRKNT